MANSFFQVQGKAGSEDGKSFKTEQQRCDARCCRHALCPHVCKYRLNAWTSVQQRATLGCLTPAFESDASLQPMHDDYDLRQEQLNKASLLSSKKFLENLLEKFITNVVHILSVAAKWP